MLIKWWTSNQTIHEYNLHVEWGKYLPIPCTTTRKSTLIHPHGNTIPTLERGGDSNVTGMAHFGSKRHFTLVVSAGIFPKASSVSGLMQWAADQEPPRQYTFTRGNKAFSDEPPVQPPLRLGSPGASGRHANQLEPPASLSSLVAQGSGASMNLPPFNGLPADWQHRETGLTYIHHPGKETQHWKDCLHALLASPV